jgi:hypothetical protein
MTTLEKKSLIRQVCFTIVLLMLTATVSMAEDWPCFRGPSRQGISGEKNLPERWSATSNIAWKTAIAGEGWSSPIVWGERVFVTTATDKGESFRLICIDRKSSAVVWDREVLRQQAGHKSRQNSYASSTPATDGQHVYVVAADGSIAAVSFKGDVVWTNRDFNYYSEHGLAVSPVLYKDLVIVPFDWSSEGPDTTLGWQKPWDKAVIVALNKNTGKVQWKGQRGASRIAHVTPQILNENGSDQLVSGAGDVVQGFDLTTGERIWTARSPGEGVVPSIVIGDGLIFATSGFGEPAIRAIRTGGRGDVTQTHIAWELRDDVPKIPSMLYVKPYLFLVTEGGLAKCIKAATGEVLGEARLKGKVSASPVWAEGKIYFLSEEGVTTITETGPEFKIIAGNELGEKCCASLAISQGQIFIRTENNLYCIGTPDAQ